MQCINPFFQLYARDGVYAEKAGAFFCHLLGFEHGYSYIADAGAQERQFKTLQTFVKNLVASCCVSLKFWFFVIGKPHNLY